MDNLDTVLHAVREFFVQDPTGVLAKQKVPSLTGIKATIVHPALQLMCDGPKSPYAKGPRADALRGILKRHSKHKNTTYTLSPKGRILFEIDGSGSNQGSLTLLDPGTMADLLIGFVGKKFTSLEFVNHFEAERPVEFASLIAKYGAGVSGSGVHYSARSYLANSLSRYAHSWRQMSGLPQLVLEGSVTAPAGEGSDKVGLWSCELGSETLVADIVAIVEAQGLENTERDQLLKARVGQGKFRLRVIEQWRCTCPVTGCNDARLLIASHIKRWCDSDNRERLDPFNGLLLSPDVDRLFDKHLISFDDSGKMLLSARIAPRLLAQLGLSSDVSIEPDPRHTVYFAAHRERMTKLDIEIDNPDTASDDFGVGG